MSIKNKQVLQQMLYAPVLMMHALVTNDECQKAFGKVMVLKLKQAGFGDCETKTEKNLSFYQPE